MEEILKGIKDLENFENKKQQWNIIKKIDGNSEAIIEEEIQEREKFKNIKMQLINTIDLTINRSDFNQITNDPKIATEHLLALKGCLILIKFDNVADAKEDMQKFKFSILKDIKNKTLEQEIETKECEDEVKRIRNLKYKFILDDEELFQDDEQKYQHKMPAVRKNKVNIFIKIKQFFKKAFGRNKIIREQNMNQIKEELKFNKRSVAPLLEKDNECEQQMNYNNIVKKQREFYEPTKEHNNPKKEVENTSKVQDNFKKDFDKTKQESAKPKTEVEEPKKEFNKRIKVNGKYAEWRNGNVVILDDLEKQEHDTENIIE